MLRLHDIIDRIRSYHTSANFDLVQKAYVYAAKHHAGQKRKSGEPYLSHPLEVAKILTDLKLDEASICTGLLHDTVEDTAATKEEIGKLFGHDIAHLVDGVTKLNQIKFLSTEEKQAENFRKMLVAMSRDIRVILVKLADRLHNMRTLQHMRTEKQEVIAQETLEIYAPIANRLGIGWMKVELEDLSFRYLKPTEYYGLKSKIGKTRRDRYKFIEDVSLEIERSLQKSGMKKFEVSGRPKHLWSIYRKMIENKLQFDDVHDLIAFRVLVNSLSECYEALGHIHSVWRPIPGRFKDYIAMPKPNGYRSLHTTLVGPKGDRVEVQIRTQEMHNVAESGIAAHWNYKELGSVALDDRSQKAGFIWLRQLMDWQRDLADPNEFLESVKVDLFSEEVYVFTPLGEVIELPREATPVDFAFAIHSDVGMHCAGARVNNRIVPLRYQLENGDTVEILTQKKPTPKKGWLEFVKTSKAKTEIRSVLRQVERERSAEIGKELLEKECRRFRLNHQQLIKEQAFERYFKKSRYKNNNEMYVALGYGKVEPRTVLEAVAPDKVTSKPKEEEKRSRIGMLFDKFAKKSSSGIRVEDVDNVLVHYARCCAPVKGDSVIGFVSRGRGLTIHRKNCTKVHELDPDRRLEVYWNDQADLSRPMILKVFSDDRGGMLAELSQVFNKMSINISGVKCQTFGDGQAINIFKISVKDLDQLRRIFRQLLAIQGVHSVERAGLSEGF